MTTHADFTEQEWEAVLEKGSDGGIGPAEASGVAEIEAALGAA
jgi:hypothetical protein